MIEKINDQRDKVKRMMHVKALEDIKEDAEMKSIKKNTTEEKPQGLSATPVIEKTLGLQTRKGFPPGLVFSPEDTLILRSFNIFGDMPDMDDLDEF